MNVQVTSTCAGSWSDETTFIPMIWSDEDARGPSTAYIGTYRSVPVTLDVSTRFGEAVRVGERFGTGPEFPALVPPPGQPVLQNLPRPRPGRAQQWSGRNYRRMS